MRSAVETEFLHPTGCARTSPLWVPVRSVDPTPQVKEVWTVFEVLKSLNHWRFPEKHHRNTKGGLKSIVKESQDCTNCSKALHPIIAPTSFTKSTLWVGQEPDTRARTPFLVRVFSKTGFSDLL